MSAVFFFDCRLVAPDDHHLVQELQQREAREAKAGIKRTAVTEEDQKVRPCRLLTSLNLTSWQT
jgi:hypothetical protein